MKHFVVSPLFLYSGTHFLFTIFLPSPISSFITSPLCSCLALSRLLSPSLLIYILVTVVTWLWWLVPGLVAVRGESFWLGIDRPWTYCMWPCRLGGKRKHIYSGNICRLSKLSLTAVVFDVIGFNNSSNAWRQGELTALLCQEKLMSSQWQISLPRPLLPFIHSLSPYMYPCALLFPPSSCFLSFILILSSYLLISTCLDVSFFPQHPSSTPRPPFSLQHEPNSHFIVLRSLWIHINRKQTTPKSGWLKHAQSSVMVINIFRTFIGSQQHWRDDTSTAESLIKSSRCGLFSFRYYFKVQAKNVFGLGPISETLTYVTESGAYPVSACEDKL